MAEDCAEVQHRLAGGSGILASVVIALSCLTAALNGQNLASYNFSVCSGRQWQSPAAHAVGGCFYGICWPYIEHVDEKQNSSQTQRSIAVEQSRRVLNVSRHIAVLWLNRQGIQ